MIRNFLMVATSDPGVGTASLVRMRLDLPATTYDTPERRLAFYRRLDERLGSIPGLRASIATTPPASGGAPRAVVVEGRPDTDLGSQPIATMVPIGDRYLDTIGAQRVRGRLFAAGDGTSGNNTDTLVLTTVLLALIALAACLSPVRARAGGRSCEDVERVNSQLKVGNRLSWELGVGDWALTRF